MTDGDAKKARQFFSGDKEKIAIIFSIHTSD